MKFENYYNKLKNRIDRRLNSFTRRKYPANLYEPIKYALLQKGKRIRPILLTFSAESLGGSIRECFDAALAIEILHDFTLVHDDIMDNDQIRRGNKTVHAKWDKNVALLCGDGLISIAYSSLLKSPEKYIKRIASIFSEGILKICEGQSLDKDFEGIADVSVNEYLIMIEKKTGVLMSMSSEIGAILGGGTEKEIKALRLYGMNIGVAFQIQDDLLDIISNQKTLGKKPGSDIAQGKKTYPIIILKSRVNNKEKNAVMKIMRKEKIDRNDILYIKEILNKYEIVEHCKEEIDKKIKRADSCLVELGSKADVEYLFRLAEMIRYRKY